MTPDWWYVVYGLLLSAISAGVALVRVLRRQLAEAKQERDDAILALGETIARHAGEQYLRDLTASWEEHVVSGGLEFADEEDAAHAFADYLANATGGPIIATQLGGDGIIVALPDEATCQRCSSEASDIDYSGCEHCREEDPDA